jgi:uncharacterized protein DUF4252
MKRIAIALPLFLASLVPALSVAQSGPQYGAPQTPAPGILEWNPPALTQLSEMATTRSSFTLDKPMLSAAAGLWPDQDNQTRQAINKIDGVSVHLLRFSDYGVPEDGSVNAVREACRQRGWQHIVTSNGKGSPIHSGTTDMWLVMDGMNVQGAVVLAETPKSVTFVTVAGKISTIDLLHLRGHFGIPRTENEQSRNQNQR